MTNFNSKSTFREIIGVGMNECTEETYHVTRLDRISQDHSHLECRFPLSSLESWFWETQKSESHVGVK